MSFLPLVFWLPSLPPLPPFLTPFLPLSPLLPYLMASPSTLLLRVASACNIFFSSRLLAVFISLGARACSLSFCWMEVVTAFIIAYFTSFSHSVAALAIMNPFLPNFVLPVIRHALSIPYFFFSNNMISLE